jgi:hypothetical protein
MLKPTKAFQDMVHQAINKGPFVMIIVKNETGIWFRYSDWTWVDTADAIISSGSGIWTRLQDIKHHFWFKKVRFDAKRMDSVGERGKEE